MEGERHLLERAGGLVAEAISRRERDPFAEISTLLAPLGPVTEVLTARNTAMAGRGQRQPELERLEGQLDQVVAARALTGAETETLRGAIRALDQETRPMFNPFNGAPILTRPERERLATLLDGCEAPELADQVRIEP
jgi:hypothetical protein